MIAFIGSVFSPYYAWARRRQGDDAAPPQAHCALNLSLYHRPAGRMAYQRLWAMTERGQQQLQRTAQTLQIGRSRLAWTAGAGLVIDVDEWTAPWPRRLRGRITLQPQALPAQDFALDAAGRHRWQPISPQGRLALDFDSPGLQWEGDAYLDANHGQRPLERDFSGWHWSRSSRPGRRSQVVYDLTTCQGDTRALALDFLPDGQIKALPLPTACTLAPTGWGLARHSRGDPAPALVATLESGPFYSRSLLRNPGDGLLAVHESLCLKRFSQPWVQALLPFRMPRRVGGRGAA